MYQLSCLDEALVSSTKKALLHLPAESAFFYKHFKKEFDKVEIIFSSEAGERKALSSLRRPLQMPLNNLGAHE